MSVSGFFWASSFGTKFALLEAYTWSNKIYLNWSSKEEYYGGHFIETSIGMVFQVCFWERRKLQLVAAFASKPVVVRYSVAS